MKPYAIIFIAVLTLFNCSNPTKKRTELIDFAPKNSDIIIKTSNFESLKNTINNNHFLKTLSKSKTYLSLEETLKNTSVLKPNNTALICFSKDKNDSIQYSFITKQDSTLFKTDSLKNYTKETLTYKNKTIVKSTLNNNVFYSTVIDSVLFASSSKPIIDAVFNTFKTNTNLKKVYSTLSDNKTCSVILKADTTFVNHFSLEPKLNLKTFTNYLAFDVDASQNEIIINGIAKATDSLKSTINIFKGTIAQENKIQTIAPANSDGFMSVTFNDFKTFETNLTKYNKKDSTYASANLLKDIIEFGIIYEGENQAIVLNSIDNIATKDALSNNKKEVETYREVTIFDFDDSLLFTKHLHPFVSFNKANVYCVIDTFFVFAETKEMLHNIIASYQNKTTINDRDYFNNIKTHLSDEASMLMVYNSHAFNSILSSNLTGTTNLNLNDYKATALQFIYDTNFAHVNGVIKKNKTNATQNTVSEELNITLEKAILNTPQFVTNHITKEKEIVVQDVNNNLYLISNKGKILWKKQLSGPVLGTINQIDIYKNGRLQLCFSTPNNVYVIDRNGNNVAPFPMKFNEAITQPLSVFDYDKKKNYRLLVTQGKNILMYNVKAQIVNGFTFKAANGPIINQPEHFRIGSKDYISFKTQNKLYILDRTGKHRVTPKTNNLYSNQPVFLYKNTFTTTTNTGNLLNVKTNGNVGIQNLNLNEKHYLATTSKTLVTLTENKLNIKNKTTELDFGNYTAPQIFYINDKIYVTVTDTQSHKVYMFDSQSKILPNFPVYGNSKITLSNIDKDAPLEFVTKGDTNSIIIYQIN
ncbi:ribonuclease HII [Seonamhaeicola algicola]|uniref:Ribonuclease HII n=3 Tax=Seonamhaeicola TaxID=1649495 RepID=A0A5C7AHM0_9FLAO|nr:ribonuclease HII [Seonamhaeicola algicola]TXE06055.1 ribonuclease HII [Seonamhaeicola algicola]